MLLPYLLYINCTYRGFFESGAFHGIFFRTAFRNKEQRDWLLQRDMTNTFPDFKGGHNHSIDSRKRSKGGGGDCRPAESRRRRKNRGLLFCQAAVDPAQKQTESHRHRLGNLCRSLSPAPSRDATKAASRVRAAPPPISFLAKYV